MSDLRTAAQQALEALEFLSLDFFMLDPISPGREASNKAITALRAALAEPEGGGNLPPPLQEPTVAENATTQQQIEQTPPSDYRRGYWAGFAIGKREGRIEAEDEPAQQAEPVLQTCNCRWDGEVQVQQCTLHEAHIDAIHEWAERVKVAERKLAQQAEPHRDLRAIERAHGIGEEK